jgi:wnt family
MSDDVTRDMVCHGSKAWLVRRQRSLLCNSQLEMIKVIRLAAKQAVIECRHQFDNELWNCPLEGGRNASSSFAISVLKKIEKSGREVKFLM